MARILPRSTFLRWLEAFLPNLPDGQPAALFTPALVSDASDGQIAHLHGLNMSRAWCWRQLAALLPEVDPRVAAHSPRRGSTQRRPCRMSLATTIWSNTGWPPMPCSC